MEIDASSCSIARTGVAISDKFRRPPLICLRTETSSTILLQIMQIMTCLFNFNSWGSEIGR